MPIRHKSMKRRAFSLIELLTVIVIISILAALLFPVFAQSKERAKQTSCQSRLRQLALGLTLYRNDHDGLGYLWTHSDHSGYRFPYNSYQGAAAYLKSGDVVWCPEPNADPTQVSAWNFYAYKSWLQQIGDAEHTNVYRSYAPQSGGIMVYCANHTSPEKDTRPVESFLVRKGKYLFVRDDLSMGMAEGSRMELWYCGADGCYHSIATPSGKANGVSTFRFPGETWPPELEK